MGSYPMMQDGKFWTRLVLRAKDAALLETAEAAVIAMVGEYKRPDAAITVTRGGWSRTFLRKSPSPPMFPARAGG